MKDFQEKCHSRNVEYFDCPKLYEMEMQFKIPKTYESKLNIQFQKTEKYSENLNFDPIPFSSFGATEN